ncbi:hypothetical protein BUALT_Bualt17G0109700 [Buddleja alternifolia]|uniref:Homeobox domain-containing protein n=1 Tax=Buddleja alternifolia TaxID=168488 RepID=A0AAV6W9I3_9LAMI|nr:hypothetical protein BUALT_Bualt17G0109700 [Buddleja alternifolia]
MWMVECNDHGKDHLKMSSTDRKQLRPLMPRPISSSTTKITPFSTIPTSCGVSDYGVKREMNSTVPLVSTRWNPTPEQLQALEELYRRGTRTPSAEQIQQIAAKLRRFGKIEGKNVFYWFQNHKARERQKKRRQLELLAGKKIRHVHTPEPKQTAGLSRRSFENEHQMKLPTPSNCRTPSEDSASMHGAVVADYKKDGRTGLDQKELQQQKINNIRAAKNETGCWQLDLSSCLPPTSTPNKTITASAQENSNLSGGLNLLSILLPPNPNNIDEQNQTLQLFPIKSNDHLRTTLNASQQEEIHGLSRIGTKFTPNQFIEFLPTKN